ncbi:hypothetical protein SprV_0300998900 [Sparganum proliferum]
MSVQAIAKSSESIQATWELPPGYNSKDIKNYALYLLGSALLAQFTVQPETTSYTFTGLSPFTNYSVAVQAIFSGAKKPALYGGASTVTWPTAGQKAKDLSFPHTRARSIMVTWSAPEKPDGEIKTYQVQATNMQTGEKVAVETLETKTSFFDLDPGTKYSISVTTENKQLDGHGGGVGPGVTAEVTTLKLDNKYSLNMQATATSSESILVNWKTPSAYVGKDIQDYLVHLSMSSVLLQRSVRPDTTTCTFTRLPPFTNATVAVQLRLRGTSKPSEYDAMSVTTWPTVGQKIQNLTITASEPRSVHATWEPPTSPQGIIESYNVSLENKGTGEGEVHTYSEAMCTLTNLDPSTRYKLTVSVRNQQLEGKGGGVGAVVSGEVTTMSLDIERPTDVTAEAISSESIQVTWKAPGYKLSNESGYRLLIIGQDFNDTAVVGRDTFTHTFTGLKPSTEYAVYVQVNDSVRGVPRPTGNSSATTWPVAGKVENLHVTAEDSRSAQVSWEPPRSTHGAAQSYGVCVQNKQTGVKQGYVFSQPTASLFNLHPSTTYKITVSVRNENSQGGRGRCGPKVSGEVSTLPLDIERPTDVTAEAISSESIQVTWKAPGYKLSNESGYRLLIIGQDFNDTAVVGRDTFTHTFTGLKPSTEYAVYVQVNDSVRGVPRPTGNSSATTWPVDRQACGRQKLAPAAWPVLQLTRHEANRHSWPWTVGLYTSTRGGYPYCGGTLVAPEWIVTAAHCVEMAMNCTSAPVGKPFSYKNLTNATLFARLGDHDLRKTEASERDRLVKSVIIHPEYQVHSGNSEHDLALLQLEKTVDPGKEVDFICLPRNDSAVFDSKECTFAGWGSNNRLRTLGYQNSPVLMEGKVKIESGGFCKLGAEGAGNDGQACLATGTGSPCFGDSGSGVYCLDAQGKWILYGIINRGSFLCGGQYATSTKILPHAKWIREAPVGYRASKAHTDLTAKPELYRQLANFRVTAFGVL